MELVLILEEFKTKLIRLKSKSELLISKLDPKFYEECNECKDLIEDIDILSDHIKSDVIIAIDKKTRELNESEEKYRLISEDSDDLIAIYDRHFNIEYINESTHSRILGYDPLQLKKKYFRFTTIHKDDFNEFAKIFKEGYYKGNFKHQIRLQHQKGHYLWFEVRGKTFFDKQGNKNLLVISRDISEIKIAERNLIESEKNYKDERDNLLNILNSMEDGVYIVNQQYKIEFINPTLKKIFGPVNDKRCYEYFQNRFEPCFICKTQKPLHENSLKWEWEIPFINKIYELIVIPLKKLNGSKSRLVIFHDITDRKQAEIALKESEKSYRTLTENLPCLIYRVNIRDNNQMEFFNDLLKPMTGYSIEELKHGDVCSIDPLILPEDRERVINEVKKSIRENLPFEIEYRLKHKNNNIKWFFERGRPIFGDNGKLYSIDGVIFDITERKNAEKALDISQMNYRNLIDNISDVIMKVDLDGKIIYSSPQIYNFFGFKGNELLGLNALEFVHPEDLPQFKKIMAEATKHKGLYSLEFRGKHKEGFYIPISAKGTTIKDEGRIRIIGVLRDISEFKEAERRLKEKQASLESIFRAAPTGIGMVVDRVFKQVNDRFCNLVDYTPNELIGKNARLVYPSDKDFEFVGKVKYDQIKEHGIGTVETRFKRKNGEILDILLSSVPIDLDDLSKGVTFTALDITERKKAEQKLKESEEKYRNLYEDAPNAYFSIDFNGSISRCNKAAEKLLGYTKEEFLKMKVFDLYADTENGLIKAKKIFQGFLIGNLIQDEELQMRHKNGNNLWISLSVKPVFDNNGKVIESQSMVININERKQVEETLKDRSKKLEILNRIITEGNKAKDLSLLLEDILDSTLELINFDGGGIYLVDKSTRTAEIVCHEGLSYDFVNSVKKKNIDELPNNTIFIQGQPLIVNNYFELNPELSKKFDILSIASIPLIGEDEIIGALNIASKFHHSFSKEEIEILLSIGREIGTIIKKNIAEHRLVKERERAELYLDVAGVIILALDQNGNITLLNKKGYEILEYKENELIGKNWFNLCIPEQQRKDIFNIFKKLMNGELESSEYAENKIITKNGKEILIAWHNSLLFDNKKNIIGTLSSGEDITERKKAEDKLKESEERLKYLVSSSPTMIYTSKVSGNYGATFISENVYEQTGYKTEEFIIDSEFWLNKIHPADKERVTSELSMLFEKQHLVYDYRFKFKDGVYHWMRDEVKLLKDENDNPLETIGSWIDITDRKIAEGRIKESEEKYRHLFESSPNAIVLTNKNGLIIDCNIATFKIFGYNKEELIGKNFLDLEIFSPNQISFFIKTYKKLQQGIEPEPYEFKLRKRDGSPIWINYQSSLVVLDGEILIELIGQDITEKKKAEEIIKEEIKKLKELDQIKSDFIDRASHELKTPLNSIYGASTFLLDYYKNFIDDKAKELLEIIKKGGERLIRLIEDLLDVSRLESGSLDLKKQKENIIEIIYECVNDLNYMAEKRHINFNLEIQEDYYLEVDKIRFEQVILNIISNAIKNTTPNGSISIKMEKHEAFIDIIIKDTGVGFTEEEKKKVFEKFGKIERYGKGMDIDTEGSGLGLYISKKIIELHNGKIWIESKGRNQGSRVIIKLPINQESSILD